MIAEIIANIKSVGVFVVVLSVLIVGHEWGHFITAKLVGIKVEKFSLGFGRKLLSKIHQGTEYLLCLIPLGGYVKMAGDERTECKGEPDEFYSKSCGHRALVVLNGSMVNFVLAYVCFVVVFMFGYPELSTNVGKLLDGYPAQTAGIEIGDKILEVQGDSVDNWAVLQKKVTSSKRDTIEIKLIREDKIIEKTINLKKENIKNIFGQQKIVRIIGISPTEDIILLKYGIGESFVKAYEKLYEIVTMTYKSLYYMITGSMSAKESMTGPVGIFLIVKAAAEMGITHLLFILGVISASLAIFNLLPVVPLDGGHLFLIGIEKIRGKALSVKIDEFIAQAGFWLIICLALFVFYSDFSKLGVFDKIKQLLP